MRRQAIAAIARAAALILLVQAASACGGPASGGEAIDREVFIETYVELRLAALDSDDFAVPPAEREEILARHGVDQEALLRFADVHGRDVDFMNEVWADVESRLEQRRSSDDPAA